MESRSFHRSKHVLAYGKVEYGYNRNQISNAEIETIEPEDLPSFQKLVPVYGLTEGIKTPQLRRMIEGALALVEDADENLPEDTVRREKLMGRLAAIRAMHDPKDWAEQREARRRIAFEELFFMQAGVLLLRKREKRGERASSARHPVSSSRGCASISPSG